MRDNRELFKRSETRSLPPANIVRRHRQCKLRPAPEKGLERAFALNARELVTEAEMDARAEGEMSVGPPLQIEPFRIRVGF